MRQKLDNPPLVEAICDLKFARGGLWADDSAVAFGATIQQLYPDTEQVTHTDYVIEEGPGGEPVVQSFGQKKWRFTSPNSPIVVQLSEGLLSVSRQQPYDRWEDFRDAITHVLRALTVVLKLAAVEQASLRYINHIQAPNRGRVRDFLCVGPRPPAAAEGRLMRRFYQRCDYTFDDGVLVLQSAIAKIGNLPGVVLDLEFVSVQPINLLPSADLDGWLNVAHDIVGDVFRTSLNPDYYDRLVRGDA